MASNSRFSHLRVQKSREAEDARGKQIVIVRCIGCSPSHKEIKESMQLHLHESFRTVTLLTPGFFEISFAEEAGAVAARKLTTVEWGGLSFCFFK